MVVPCAGQATASVIWLHGLGADGNDFVPVVPQLRLPPSMAVRFVFPHAPVRPVTINGGAAMRAWYDIAARTLAGRQDEGGIRESAGLVSAYIERELAAGVAAARILVAGFSQGGAVALHTVLRYPVRLAGVLALSTYLPLHEKLAEEAAIANQSTPILMCHGRYDPMIPIELAEASRQALLGLGYGVEWKEYPMQHEVCAQEIRDIALWLQHRLSAEPARG